MQSLAKIIIEYIKASAVLLIFFSLSAAAQEREWKTFTAPNGDWTILAPGEMKPDEEALKNPSDKGSFSYTDFNGFFAVVYRDAPKRYLPWKRNYQSYYTKVSKDAMKAANGEIISDAEFVRGNLKGREVFIRIPNAQAKGRESVVKQTYRIERLRMFFHGRRFYLLLAVLPPDQIRTAAIDKYLDSFTLTR